MTDRGEKVSHFGVPGVQGPPSPTKRPSSPVKPSGEDQNTPANDDYDPFEDYDMTDFVDRPFSWGKVTCSTLWPFGD